MWNKEEIKSLYEAIPHRKSVRKYKDVRVSDEMIQKAQEALDEVKILFPDAPVAVQILRSEYVKGKFSTKNAAYVAVYANREPKAYADAGAILEQMHLWFSSQGIGSWIHGLSAPIKPYDVKDGLPFVFILTFGNADEAVNRNGADEFTRQAISTFTDVEGIDDYVETMRLAASGRNRQPWRITGTKDKMVVYTIKDNKLFAKIMPDLWLLDGGIAMTHLWLEAEHQGKEIQITYNPADASLSSKEDYGCTIEIY